VSHEDANGWGSGAPGYWGVQADDGRAGRSYYPAPGWQPPPQPLTPESLVRGLFAPLFGGPAAPSSPGDPRAHARQDPDNARGGRPN